MGTQEFDIKDAFKAYSDILNVYCSILDEITGSKTEIVTYDFATDEICSNLVDYVGNTMAFTIMKQNKIYFKPSLFINWLYEDHLKIAYKNENDMDFYGEDILLYTACHEYVHCQFNLKNHTKRFRNIAVYLFNEVKKVLK